MDLLFSKYASPFIFLDEMISCGRFTEFIGEFINIENERQEYEYWLHKVFDKSFEDFRKSIRPREEVNEGDVETTLINSKNILSNFVPQ